MRHVFVHYKNGLYNIIDKASPTTTFDKINDVLLFNATYKRFGNIKGWHGILSEEMNENVARILNLKFTELKYFPKVYYPKRHSFIDGENYKVKNVTFLRLQDGKEYMRGEDHMGGLEHYLKSWTSFPDNGHYLREPQDLVEEGLDEDEDDWEDYGDEE